MQVIKSILKYQIINWKMHQKNHWRRAEWISSNWTKKGEGGIYERPVFIDLEKDFDRTNLWQILETEGYPPQIINVRNNTAIVIFGLIYI